MRLWFGTAVLAGSQGVGTVLGVATGVLVSRVLGPAGKGDYAILVMWLQIANVLGNLGFYRSNMYYAGHQPAERRRIAANNAWIAVALGLTTAAALYAWLVHTSLLRDVPPRLLAVMLAAAPLYFYNQYSQGILLGMGDIVACQAVDLATRFILLVGTGVVTLGLHHGLTGLVWWYTFTLLGQSVAYAVTIHVRLGWGPWRPDMDLFMAMVRYAARTYGAALFTFVLSRLDLMFVYSLRGDGAAGAYSIAMQVVDALSYVPLAIAAQLIPQLAGDSTRDATVTCQTARLLCLLMTALAGGVAVFVWPGVRILYGVPFLPAVSATWAILPGVMMVALQTLLAGDLGGRGYPSFLVWVWIPGLVLSALLQPFAIAAAGLVGAALVTSLAYAVVCVVTVWYFLRFHDLHWSTLIPGRAEFFMIWRRLARQGTLPAAPIRVES